MLNFKTKSKYNSVITEVDWIKFHSKLESKFYLFLQESPSIKLLDRQTKFVLQDKFKNKEWESIREIYYKSDFYIEYNGLRYYIDSKWNEDSVFKIKHKMWLKRYWDTNTLLICKSIKDLKEKIKYV